MSPICCQRAAAAGVVAKEALLVVLAVMGSKTPQVGRRQAKGSGVGHHTRHSLTHPGIGDGARLALETRT